MSLKYEPSSEPHLRALGAFDAALPGAAAVLERDRVDHHRELLVELLLGLNSQSSSTFAREVSHQSCAASLVFFFVY